MVEISEVIEEAPTSPQAATYAVDSRSQERFADADEIEAALLAHITRPSAQLHLQNLITKLRKEGKALQRVAASTSAATAAAGSSDSAAQPPPAVAKPAPPVEVPTPPKKSPVTTPIITSTTNKYQTFPTHYFDCGEYNSPLVTIYAPLSGIGTHDKSKISCNFTSTSFDLIVSDFTDGKSYRLLNDNLEKEIDVSKSKYVVKPNKILIKLGKIKGEYSYDHWTELTAKKKKENKGKKEDPAAGIMDLMKDMYESGDDNMKKMIGETMYKQRTGQLGKDGAMGGMGGMDMGLGDMGI
uniref:Calcyclin-binding protein n=1 Tax=Skeletonema marinoi TaxID=267567 RepID=A0A7S2PGT2_9STRA